MLNLSLCPDTSASISHAFFANLIYFSGLCINSWELLNSCASHAKFSFTPYATSISACETDGDSLDSYSLHEDNDLALGQLPA